MIEKVTRTNNQGLGLLGALVVTGNRAARVFRSMVEEKGREPVRSRLSCDVARACGVKVD